MKKLLHVRFLWLTDGRLRTSTLWKQMPSLAHFLEAVQTFHDFSHGFDLYLIILPVFFSIGRLILSFLRQFMYILYVLKVFLL